MDSNKQIVCISTHYWDDSWFRKQHFMSRFVRNGYKVAYIEPSFPMARKPDPDKASYQTNKAFSVTFENIDDHLYIVKPPRLIPFSSRPNVSKLNNIYLAFQLKRALKKIGFADYILWIYPPQYAPAISMFDYRKLIFDITDDLAAYNQDNQKIYNYTKQCKEFIVKKSDLVITTASTLFSMYKDMSKNICLIPNGYDSNLMSGNTVEVPDDVKSLSSPIIGFIGTLFSFLDYDLLEYIIRNNSNKSFVFIGALETVCEKEWMNIVNTYKNVFWLGKKKKADIPSYLGAFDVCINPFKVDDVSRSVSPLKVFEYLAMKKPVVSVRMESLEEEDVASYIYFADSFEDFNEKLKVSIQERGVFREKLEYQKIEKYSWEKLFDKALAAIAGLEKHT